MGWLNYPVCCLRALEAGIRGEGVSGWLRGDVTGGLLAVRGICGASLITWCLPVLCACLSKSPLCTDSSETSSYLVSSAVTLLPNRVTPKVSGLGLHRNLGRIQFTP